MKSGRWQWLKRMPDVLEAARPERAEYTRRNTSLQRNIFLPARLIVIAAVFYQLYNSPWLGNDVTTFAVLFETMENVFRSYAALIVVTTVVFFIVRKFPPGSIQWIVFALGLADGIFLGGLTVLTGGFESILYWAYPALIIFNAISIPIATPQIVLNLMLGIIFLGSGLISSSSESELTQESRVPKLRQKPADAIEDPFVVASWLKDTPRPFRKRLWDGLRDETRSNILILSVTRTNEKVLKALLTEEVNSIFPSPKNYAIFMSADLEVPKPNGDQYVLQVAVLLLFTFCCYGVQVLAAGQRRAEDERNEFIVRGEQLRSAGRLAAEVAHQIKNPLAIINNVTFSLQKNLSADRPAATQQIDIIREEVAKADRIITQIMGYAQLTEGRVEKLNVVDEINRAIAEVFPPSLPGSSRIHRQFAAQFPPLLLQRKHFVDAVSNLLQNARDATENGGDIYVGAQYLEDYSVEITVRDTGEGIPPDKIERVFEAYYSTKSRGTGLGLAVVKHNAELYGGSVRAESELGKGSKFTLLFPAKTLMQPLST